MNTTKYGISDDAFLARMLEHCRDDEERGWTNILFLTGMHGNSLRTLSKANLVRQGDRTFLQWRRMKNKKLLEAEIPSDKVGVITPFLEASRKKSLRWVNFRLHQMGEKAGYQGISTMTFRHTKCIRMILDGVPMPVIADKMGCTQAVVTRAYGKLTPEQLREATRPR